MHRVLASNSCNHRKHLYHDNEKDVKLTQQNEEKHIPIYSQGTRTPDISLLSNERTEPGSLGKLFKFQPELMYLMSEGEQTC